MFDEALKTVGLICTFCGVTTLLFFLIGLTMNYAWRKMQDAVGFYRLHRCWRLVNRVMKRHKIRKGEAL